MKPSELPKTTRVFVRMSSTEWEMPSDSQKCFAEIVNDKKHFRAKIHLNQIDNGSFDKDEIDVHLHNYDVQIHASRENPNNPNRPLRILNRQYRLPCDIDLKTIRLKRNESREEVDVKANKIPERGMLIGLNIVDMTPSGRKVTRLQAF